jgi:glycine betaine/proline transport system substrate-binding protein
MRKSNYRRLLTVLPISFLLLGCETGDAEEESSNVGEDVEYTITATEPGAGLTELTHNTVEAYDNLEGWEVMESSTAGMITSLDQAVKNEEPIIVTAWRPHWIFESYDLKFLEDPKNTLGEEEFVHTIARLGLEEDQPEAYAVLDAFEWETEDMQKMMLEAQDASFEEVTADWVEDNQDYIDELLEGIDPVDGEDFELISTPWDTERSSASVMEAILEQLGYNVEVTNVDPVVMFQVIATGEGDASLAPWLPTTHGTFLDEYGEDIDDLGPNMEGTLNGFVVPEYMDVDSIEDLPTPE